VARINIKLDREQARPGGSQLPSAEMPGDGGPAEPADDDERSANALLRIVLVAAR